MNTDEFKLLLDAHDFHYMMSDDPKYYRAGEYNEHRLKNLCKGNEEFTALYQSGYNAAKKARSGA